METVRARSVLIPLANPALAQQYLHLGGRIAEACESSVVLLHLIATGATSKASAALPAGANERAQKVLNAAQAHLSRLRGVPVETVTRETHDVAEGIVQMAFREHFEFLIMGWRGDIRGGKSVIGSDIEGVVRESNTHTIVMQRGAFKEGERLLLPVANPDAAALALAVASLLRDNKGPKITVLHLSPVVLSDREKEHFCESLFSLARESRHGPQALFTDMAQFDVRFEVQDDPASELARRSGDYDRMIMGTSRSGYADAHVFGALPMHIAGAAACPVVFVRRKGMAGA